MPNNTVRWVTRGDLRGLPEGSYEVILVGDPQRPDTAAIVSQQGHRLDGEPSQLPSGDNQEGGNFVLSMRIA
jgi:hypothetical protein